MCQVQEISSSFVLMKSTSFVFIKVLSSLLDSLSSTDRQEIVGLLRGCSASNQSEFSSLDSCLGNLIIIAMI